MKTSAKGNSRIVAKVFSCRNKKYDIFHVPGVPRRGRYFGINIPNIWNLYKIFHFKVM